MHHPPNSSSDFSVDIHEFETPQSDSEPEVGGRHRDETDSELILRGMIHCDLERNVEREEMIGGIRELLPAQKPRRSKMLR